MIVLSNDPNIAERQMAAVIYYLVTFGYIDGDFDPTELAYVRGLIEQLVAHRVDTAVGPGDPLRSELIEKYTAHFLEVLEWTDRQVRAMFDESVARDEPQDAFVRAQLTRRCFEHFRGLDASSQQALMDAVDELLLADGIAHPAEVRFRGELAQILGAEERVDFPADPPPENQPAIAPVGRRAHKGRNHPFLQRAERHFSADPIEIASQMDEDRALIGRVLELLAAQRRKGKGRLAGQRRVSGLAGQTPFLDGYVYALPRQPGRTIELTVLGDLHGCYSCLKAALMQSEFLDKVDAHNRSPDTAPIPLLVLLGDYIDRGFYSYNGVLRAVLQLFATAPDYVCLLRGNHEYYVEHEGTIYGGVRPAEAIETLRPYAPGEMFRAYKELFDSLPGMLFFDEMLFVHGGIPRDATLKERYTDLASLNDWKLRFEMMWSDPSSADVIPAALQSQTARFPFGRLQFQAFMQRVGCHTLVRGHEKVEEGFRTVYEDPPYRLVSLFSAGGRDNHDLPARSTYRQVEPKALTVTARDDELVLTPWDIDYAAYNDPQRNAFLAEPPPIELKA